MSSSNVREHRPEWDRILSAAQKNNAAEIQRLVSEEGVSASHANAVEQSALHIAALWGNVEALRALLSLSANTNAQNTITGGTPLHCTVTSSKEPASNRVTCAKLLIEVGMADPKLADFYDATPLDYLENSRNKNGTDNKPQLTNFGPGDEVQEEEYYTQMREVLTSSAGPEAALELFQYIQQVDVDGLMSHLQEKAKDGADDLASLLEERERGGLTPLLYVVIDIQKICREEGATEAQIDHDQLGRMTQIVKLLLERGAQANATPKRITIRTPFSPPPTEETPEEMEKAVEAALSSAPMHTICTELYSINASSSTPSESLLRPRLEEMAVALKNYGATLSKTTCCYLHDAARRGYLDTVRFWVETLRVDIDAKGRQGMTALHFAARSGKIDIVKYLLSKGAGRGCLDDRGKTALDAATVNGKEEVVVLLNLMDD